MDVPSAQAGHFTLHRFNGDEVYGLASAVMWAAEDEGGVTLSFEATAHEEEAERLPDTEERELAPYAEVAVALPSLTPDQLVGQVLVQPESYVEEMGGQVAFLEYAEQAELRESEVRILSRAGDRFHVRWTGVTCDVNHYDGSKPETQVEIEGEFLFQDMDQWVNS